MEKERIREAILALGADVCGVAAEERFRDCPPGMGPRDLFSACQSVVVFGVALPKGLTKVPSRLIYGHYNYDLCHDLDRIALQGAKYIERETAALAVPLPSDVPYEVWDAPRKHGHGLLSLKHAAVAAGLGQLGKSTLLLNHQYGNLLVLGAILTDLALPSDSLCAPLCLEQCTICIDQCPSGAIQEGRVVQKLCRENTYGKTARGFNTVDCNRCRALCPVAFGTPSAHR